MKFTIELSRIAPRTNSPYCVVRIAPQCKPTDVWHAASWENGWHARRIEDGGALEATNLASLLRQFEIMYASQE